MTDNLRSIQALDRSLEELRRKLRETEAHQARVRSRLTPKEEREYLRGIYHSDPHEDPTVVAGDWQPPG